MILQLVTDRRRLAPRSDDQAAFACLLQQVEFAVQAGVDMIQVRERDLDGRMLADLVARIVHRTRGTSTRVVVNDRLDVAVAAGADGVHLRGDSFDAARVRPHVAPGFLIGRSIRSTEDARQAGPVDYLLAGTVWATSSKREDHALLGVDGLKAIAAAATVPVLAIGGVTPARAAAIAAAGAAGAAAISAWMGGTEPCRAVSVQEPVQAFRTAFRTGNINNPSRW